MASHRIYGTVRIAGAPAARALDVVDAAAWHDAGLEAAIVASTTSDGGTGAWSVDLDGDALVYVFARPVPPYKPLLLGPYRPVAIAP